MSTRKIKSTSASSSVSPTVQAQMPPVVTVPVPPVTYDPTVTIDYRSAQPRSAELAAVSGAAREVGDFTDWDAVFGKTAPPAAQLQQALQTVAAWTTLLVASNLWFVYVRDSAAIAWKDARGLVEALKVPFALASAADPTLTSTNPSLTRLLDSAKAIAAKSVATKKANAKADAEGKPQTHGKVGKTRKKQAAAAALAAATSASTTPPVAAPSPEPAPAAPPATSAPAHA
jgi:hypothetical protein